MICLQQAAQARQLQTDFVLGQRSENSPTKRWLRLKIGSQTYLYCQGVLLRGLPDGSFRHINGLAVEITKRKHLTKSFLQLAGISTPVGSCFTREEAALADAWFSTWGQPVCLKPEKGKKGRLVSPYIADRQTFRKAFSKISASYRQVIVEEHFSGQVLRYFYVEPNAIAVKVSRLASVIGNGTQTLEELIIAKNQLRLERQLPGHYLLPIDEFVDACLQRQGLDLNHVPPPGRQITLHDVSNAEAGTDSIACPVHDSYARLIEKACQSIPGLNIAAIDLMVQDMNQAASPENYRLLEINSSPGVVPFHYPWEGPVQDVSGTILDKLAETLA